MTVATDFRSLAAAALRVSGQMLDDLTPEAQQGIEGALQGGARLELAFGPLPAFERLSLVLVEREGRRHVLSSIDVLSGPLQ